MNSLCIRFYNGFEVIDMIAYQDMIKILNEPKLDVIVNKYWRGPFERETFVNYSFCYQEIMKACTKNHKFFDYSFYKHPTIWDKHKKNMANNKAHFFQFENWKNSIDVTYIVDGVCIIIYVIIVQVLFILLKMMSNKYFIADLSVPKWFIKWNCHKFSSNFIKYEFG